MANGQHGGYRAPQNPAPVSGPGALSQRTDGRQPVRDMPDAGYGENKAFRQAQQGAPMNEASGGGGASITPMGAPSERPDEPITAGLPMGAGGGSTMAPQQGGGPLSEDQAERLKAALPVLINMASRDDADPYTKLLVRRLRSQLH